MTGRRVHVEAEAVLSAWQSASSGNDCARRLGIVASPTAQRLVEEAGLVWPNPAWGQITPPDQQEPSKRIDCDMVIDRVRSQRDEYKRLYDETRSQLRSQQEICKSIAAEFVTPRPAPVFPATGNKAGSDHKPKRAVILQVSDWQMGQLVRPEDVGGINEYSWPTMLARLQRWRAAAVASIRIQQAGFNIREGVLLFCGDMVEGHDIYRGQAWQLDKDAALQALDGADAWAVVLEALATALPEIRWSVYCVPGNHGKPGTQ